jgi:hypothetical protein
MGEPGCLPPFVRTVVVPAGESDEADGQEHSEKN